LIETRFFDNLASNTTMAPGLPAKSAPTPTTPSAESSTWPRLSETREIRSPPRGVRPIRFESTTYDAQGRIASVTTPEGTISYAYDRLGRLASTSVGAPGAPERITRYTYDALGRLETVREDQQPADPASPTLDTRYGYTLLGSLRRTDLPNGVIQVYAYDQLNRLDLLTHYGPDDTPDDLSDNPVLARFDYTVQADGRRSGLTETFYADGQATRLSPTRSTGNTTRWAG
jgi:YD repeat-containing protein